MCDMLEEIVLFFLFILFCGVLFVCFWERSKKSANGIWLWFSIIFGWDLVLVLAHCLCRAARESAPWFQKLWVWFWAGGSHFSWAWSKVTGPFCFRNYQCSCCDSMKREKYLRRCCEGCWGRLPRADDLDFLGFGAHLVLFGLGQHAQSQEACQCLT